MALQKFQVYADKPALLSCNQTMKLYNLTVALASDSGKGLNSQLEVVYAVFPNIYLSCF